MANKPLVVALAGNPNTGKSTVFNALTGLRQHTGEDINIILIHEVKHIVDHDPSVHRSTQAAEARGRGDVPELVDLNV